MGSSQGARLVSERVDTQDIHKVSWLTVEYSLLSVLYSIHCERKSAIMPLAIHTYYIGWNGPLPVECTPMPARIRA